MYDRAPRNLNLTIGCTPEHIGPGTYEHRRKKTSEEGYAPFLSLSNRGDIFSYDENPGPGQYDLRNNQSTIIKVKDDDEYELYSVYKKRFLLINRE